MEEGKRKAAARKLLGEGARFFRRREYQAAALPRDKSERSKARGEGSRAITTEKIGSKNHPIGRIGLTEGPPRRRTSSSRMRTQKGGRQSEKSQTVVQKGKGRA